MGDEIKLRGEISKTLNMIKAVQNLRDELSIEEMMKVEEVDDVLAPSLVDPMNFKDGLIRRKVNNDKYVEG